MVLAFITRFTSFFLPACLLITGGAGLAWYTLAGAAEQGEAVFLLCISAGFLAASGLTRLFSEKTLLWPLLPGAAGVVVGVVMLI